jgi:probable HAF family extracellular repeat protein
MRVGRGWVVAVVAVVATVAVVAGPGGADASGSGSSAVRGDRPIRVVELHAPDGVSNPRPIEINRRGQVLAEERSSEPSLPPARGVFWDRRATEGTLVAGPDGTYAVPRDLNDQGLVAGDVDSRPVSICVSSLGAPVQRVGFTWRAGTMTPLDHGMAPCSFVSRLNNVGQVIGVQRSQTAESLVVWQGASIVTTFSPLPGAVPLAADLNDQGQVLFSASSGPDTEFEITRLWQIGGAFTDLGRGLGGVRTRGVDLNEQGQVVGYSQTATGELHAFLWQDGEITDLGTLGGANSSALGINERGQVFGTSETADGETHAFFWEDGEMTDLGRLPGPTDEAVARAINDRGQVVGTSNGRAFLWDDGEMTDLGAAVADAGSDAVDINNRGQVVGTRNDPDGTTQVVIWNTR